MRDDQMTPAPSLVRSIGVMGVLFLTLSVATPASSVFVIVPGMLQIAGTGAVWATSIAYYWFILRRRGAWNVQIPTLATERDA